MLVQISLVLAAAAPQWTNHTIQKAINDNNKLSEDCNVSNPNRNLSVCADRLKLPDFIRDLVGKNINYRQRLWLQPEPRNCSVLLLSGMDIGHAASEFEGFLRCISRRKPKTKKAKGEQEQQIIKAQERFIEVTAEFDGSERFLDTALPAAIQLFRNEEALHKSSKIKAVIRKVRTLRSCRSKRLKSNRWPSDLNPWCWIQNERPSIFTTTPGLNALAKPPPVEGCNAANEKDRRLKLAVRKPELKRAKHRLAKIDRQLKVLMAPDDWTQNSDDSLADLFELNCLRRWSCPNSPDIITSRTSSTAFKAEISKLPGFEAKASSATVATASVARKAAKHWDAEFRANTATKLRQLEPQRLPLEAAVQKLRTEVEDFEQQAELCRNEATSRERVSRVEHQVAKAIVWPGNRPPPREYFLPFRKCGAAVENFEGEKAYDNRLQTLRCLLESSAAADGVVTKQSKTQTCRWLEVLASIGADDAEGALWITRRRMHALAAEPSALRQHRCTDGTPTMAFLWRLFAGLAPAREVWSSRRLVDADSRYWPPETRQQAQLAMASIALSLGLFEAAQRRIASLLDSASDRTKEQSGIQVTRIWVGRRKWAQAERQALLVLKSTRDSQARRTLEALRLRATIEQELTPVGVEHAVLRYIEDLKRGSIGSGRLSVFDAYRDVSLLEPVIRSARRVIEMDDLDAGERILNSILGLVTAEPQLFTSQNESTFVTKQIGRIRCGALENPAKQSECSAVRSSIDCIGGLISARRGRNRVALGRLRSCFSNASRSAGVGSLAVRARMVGRLSWHESFLHSAIDELPAEPNLKRLAVQQLWRRGSRAFSLPAEQARPPSFDRLFREQSLAGLIAFITIGRGDQRSVRAVRLQRGEMVPTLLDVGPIAEVRSRVDAVVLSLSRRRSGRRALRRAYNLLLRDILPDEAGGRWAIITGGDIARLPLHALHDGSRHLVDRIEFIMVPDLAMLRSWPPSGSRILALGDPTVGHLEPSPTRRLRTATGSFRRLPGTRAEARLVGASAPNSLVLVGAKATGSELKSALSSYPRPRILHIASHGILEATQTGRSESVVLLSSETPARTDQCVQAGDGECRLRGSDVNVVEYGSVELAVLSACESGVGESSPGLGIQGLRFGLFQAGVQTVVTSLWSVDDAVTVELMRDFYSRLRRGQRRHSALYGAMRDIKREYPEPYYWAAFSAEGAEGPLCLEGWC